jgi:hypothetical protein
MKYTTEMDSGGMIYMLFRVWGEVEFHFDVCRAVAGAHTELH